MDSFDANELAQPLLVLDEGSQHEQADKNTSLFTTFLNGVNVISGIGILSIPYALAKGGWLSLLPFLLVAIVCWYTALLLQRCMNVDQRIKTYPDIAELAFGYKGRVIVSLLLYVELYLVAVEFLILEGDNLERLFPEMGFNIAGLKIGGKQAFVLLTSLVILPTTWLRSLGMLAYISAGGVLASFILVICITWAGIVEGGESHQDKYLGNVILNWRGMPTAISMFVFCYCGHPVFPVLYNSMGDKHKFSKVLLVCFITSTLSYGSVAVLGYSMYGEHSESQITLNLPIREISTKIAIYSTLINPLAKYAIMTTPIANVVEEISLFHNSQPWSIIIRTVIVISTVIVALTIPFFGYVMAFIGSFLGVSVAMLLPCMCYLKINKSAWNFGVESFIIVAILVGGSFVALVGTFTSVKQIVNHF